MMQRLSQSHNRQTDSGSTLIEVMFSIALFALILTAFALLMISSNKTIRESRTRQQANAVGTEALEEVRALPLSVISAGISTTDAATDPALTSNGTTYFFRGLPLITSNSVDPQTSPLNPHTYTTQAPSPSDTLYTVTTYPVRCWQDKTNPDSCNTAATSYRDSEIIRIIAIVSYQDSMGHSIERQFSTAIFDEVGCQLNAVQTFVGPCEPFFYGSADITAGEFSVETGEAFSEESPVDFDEFDVDLPALTARVRQEQVLTVVADAAGSVVDAEGEPSFVHGGLAALSYSSTDPAKNASAPSAQSFSQTPAPTGVIGTGDVYVTILGGAADTGATVTSVKATYPDNCTFINGVIQGVNQPCASTKGTSTGADVTLSLGPEVAVSGISYSTSGTLTNRVWASKASTSPLPVCLTPSGDGCVESAAQRATGALDIMAFAPDTAAAITEGLGTSKTFTGAYFHMDSATATATAWEGYNTGAKVTAELTSPNITYWDGSGMTTLRLDSLPQGSTIPVADLTSAFTYKSDTWQIKMKANLVTGSITTESEPQGASCLANACTARAYIGSPVSGYVDVWAERNGDTVANYRIEVDLGATEVTSTYQAAS